MNTLIFNNIRDFDLEQIFECGQCFRWKACADNMYEGVAFDRYVQVEYIDHRLAIYGADEADRELWASYFDLDRDYGYIKAKISSDDENMAKAIEKGPGIRILKQDPWEAIISFIISQNNNIPRIKSSIEKLCQCYGKDLGEGHYAFPDIDTLADLNEGDLDQLKLGYRQAYIIHTAKKIKSLGAYSYLDKLLGDDYDYEACYNELIQFKGIGPKVANCIALFGFNKFDAFPIDVWMKRVMNKLYGFEESDLEGMSAYAKEHFGEYRGIAQQHLFYYMRALDGEHN
ncbi:MAG: 8-oxoguanine DNA glycosylase [Clostridia bacterium]|nr:8-oxoguanine DNA glycosylase [Clostridia bacterium]